MSSISHISVYVIFQVNARLLNENDLPVKFGVKLMIYALSKKCDALCLYLIPLTFLN